MKVRSKGEDIVVRYAGRRLRVTSEWTEVREDAVEKLISEAGDRLEVQREAPQSVETTVAADAGPDSQAASGPRGKKKGREPKGGGDSSGDAASEED